MKRQTTVVTVVWLCLVMVASARAQDCSALTRWGIYDQTATNSDDQLMSRIADWFTHAAFQSSSQAQSASGGCSAEVEGVFKIEGGGGNDEKKWEIVKDSLAHYSSYSADVRNRISTSARVVNADIVRSMQGCLQAFGLHVYLEVGDASPASTSQVFTIVAQFAPYGVGPTVAHITGIGLGNSITCSGPGMPTTTNWSNQSIPVGIGGVRLRCQRAGMLGSEEQVVVNSDASIVGTGKTASGVLTLAAVVAPPPLTSTSTKSIPARSDLVYLDEGPLTIRSIGGQWSVSGPGNMVDATGSSVCCTLDEAKTSTGFKYGQAVIEVHSRTSPSVVLSAQGWLGAPITLSSNGIVFVHIADNAGSCGTGRPSCYDDNAGSVTVVYTRP